ncbi:hypothetical protein FIBSPDRAFT_445759 [Athelia psychrophila]|uniref:Uncharacterized protein n=1 Tax=Athelia psychrophila TaxID=1759441 RepID=A0A166MA32_9AGAM|nr:hypothetical protein FIBSPDRAFT_445759 [Fibularhizoctonia sp. CBS 109695]
MFNPPLLFLVFLLTAGFPERRGLICRVRHRYRCNSAMHICQWTISARNYQDVIPGQSDGSPRMTGRFTCPRRQPTQSEDNIPADLDFTLKGPDCMATTSTY